MRRHYLRAAIAASFVWFVLLCAIATYEAFTVDPWSFLGENRGPMFFTWSSHLVFDGTAFGNFVLVFDAFSFWAAVLLPIVALIAVAFAARRLEHSIHRSRRYR